MMKRQTLSGMLVSAALAMAVAAPASAAPPNPAPARNDGLVQVPSRTLDEVYVRPDVNFQSYRKVMVDPGTVTMRKELAQEHQSDARTVALAVSVGREENNGPRGHDLSSVVAEIVPGARL